MSFNNFSFAYRHFVKTFTNSTFDDALARLKRLERDVETPEQQSAHDALVEAVYKFFDDEEETEDYVIVG